jgi:hypothetical protein
MGTPSCLHWESHQPVYVHIIYIYMHAVCIYNIKSGYNIYIYNINIYNMYIYICIYHMNIYIYLLQHLSCANTIFKQSLQELTCWTDSPTLLSQDASTKICLQSSRDLFSQAPKIGAPVRLVHVSSVFPIADSVIKKGPYTYFIYLQISSYGPSKIWSTQHGNIGALFQRCHNCCLKGLTCANRNYP